MLYKGDFVELKIKYMHWATWILRFVKIGISSRTFKQNYNFDHRANIDMTMLLVIIRVYLL